LLKHTLLQDGFAIKVINTVHPRGLAGCSETFQNSAQLYINYMNNDELVWISPGLV